MVHCPRMAAHSTGSPTRDGTREHERRAARRTRQLRHLSAATSTTARDAALAVSALAGASGVSHRQSEQSRRTTVRASRYWSASPRSWAPTCPCGLSEHWPPFATGSRAGSSSSSCGSSASLAPLGGSSRHRPARGFIDVVLGSADPRFVAPRRSAQDPPVRATVPVGAGQSAIPALVGSVVDCADPAR